jgi:hypothetical protein
MNNSNNPLARLKKSPVATKEDFLNSAATNVAISEASVEVAKESNVVDLDSLLNEVNSVKKKEVLKPETTLLNADEKKMLEILSKKAGMTKSSFLRSLVVEEFKRTF